MTSSDRAFRAAHLLSPNTLAFWNLRALRPHYPQRKCHSQAALGRQDQLSAHCGPSPLGARAAIYRVRSGSSHLLVQGGSALLPPACVDPHTCPRHTQRRPRDTLCRVGGVPPNPSRRAPRVGREGVGTEPAFYVGLR